MKKIIMSFYTLFVVLTLLSILAIYAFSPNFSNTLNAHIGAHSETDISVLVVALTTYIVAAATLLVSWLIKKEATEIGKGIISQATVLGNKVICSATIQRYVDRMHYDYSDSIEKAYQLIQSKRDDPELAGKFNEVFILYVSLNARLWLQEKMNVNESLPESIEGFMVDLMPGELGNKYFELLGIRNIISVFDKKDKFVTERMDKISEEKDDQKLHTFVNDVKFSALTDGKAVHSLMLALGWVPQNEVTKLFDLLAANYDVAKWTASLNGLKKTDTMS